MLADSSGLVIYTYDDSKGLQACAHLRKEARSQEQECLCQPGVEKTPRSSQRCAQERHNAFRLSNSSPSLLPGPSGFSELHFQATCRLVPAVLLSVPQQPGAEAIIARAPSRGWREPQASPEEHNYRRDNCLVPCADRLFHGVCYERWGRRAVHELAWRRGAALAPVRPPVSTQTQLRPCRRRRVSQPHSPWGAALGPPPRTQDADEQGHERRPVHRLLYIREPRRVEPQSACRIAPSHVLLANPCVGRRPSFLTAGCAAPARLRGHAHRRGLREPAARPALLLHAPGESPAP